MAASAALPQGAGAGREPGRARQPERRARQMRGQQRHRPGPSQRPRQHDIGDPQRQAAMGQAKRQHLGRRLGRDTRRRGATDQARAKIGQQWRQRPGWQIESGGQARGSIGRVQRPWLAEKTPAGQHSPGRAGIVAGPGQHQRIAQLRRRFAPPFQQRHRCGGLQRQPLPPERPDRRLVPRQRIEQRQRRPGGKQRIFNIVPCHALPDPARRGACGGRE